MLLLQPMLLLLLLLLVLVLMLLVFKYCGLTRFSSILEPTLTSSVLCEDRPASPPPRQPHIDCRLCGPRTHTPQVLNVRKERNQLLSTLRKQERSGLSRLSGRRGKARTATDGARATTTGTAPDATGGSGANVGAAASDGGAQDSSSSSAAASGGGGSSGGVVGGTFDCEAASATQSALAGLAALSVEILADDDEGIFSD